MARTPVDIGDRVAWRDYIWDESFARSADVLAHLADGARAERRAGRTLPLDPDDL